MKWILKRDATDDDTPQIYIWVIFWLEIVEGIIGVVTFGYVQFDFALRWIDWYLNHIEKKKAQIKASTENRR